MTTATKRYRLSGIRGPGRRSAQAKKRRGHRQADGLTGLRHRHGLLARLEQACATQSGSGRLAVVYLDPSNVRQIDDTLGHAAGAEVLRKMDLRLQNRLSPLMVGRFASDAFLAIVTVEAGDGDVYPAAIKAVKAIVAIFERAVFLRGNLLRLSCSIGIAVHSRPEDRASTLIRAAAEAMRAAKVQTARDGKTTWRFYAEAMRESERR